jgi:hypothetical protein
MSTQTSVSASKASLAQEEGGRERDADDEALSLQVPCSPVEHDVPSCAHHLGLVGY